MRKIAISIGDLNGIGIEIALKSHKEISKFCKPVYAISKEMLNEASKLLKLPIDSNFTISSCGKEFKIKPGVAIKESGLYSYDSFIHALNLTKTKECDALVTLPVNKKAWELAGIKYKGHTEALEDLLNEKATMVLGCAQMYVALYTHHIPLKEVPALVNEDKVFDFLKEFYNSFKKEPIAVLGLNPHAGDFGVIGNEDEEILKAIKKANKVFKKEIFFGPIVPDIAFTPKFRERFKYFIAMYHDQGLAPLKALFFEKSINFSLGLSIVRTSVDHGTAFDIAYKDKNPSTLSYKEAILAAIEFCK